MEAQFSPGDVILFRGRNLKSFCIAAASCTPSQWLTDCAPSHCAIISSWRDRTMLFESTTLCDVPCEILRRKVRGVQAHTPLSRIESYRGRVWLMRPLDPLVHWQQVKLADACLSHVGDEYGWSDLVRAGSILGRLRTWIPRPHNPDCAHYVLSVLRDACVLGRNLAPSTKSPAWVARTLPYQEIYAPPVRLK